jgi:hypothetical protein
LRVESPETSQLANRSCSVSAYKPIIPEGKGYGHHRERETRDVVGGRGFSPEDGKQEAVLCIILKTVFCANEKLGSAISE